LLLVAFFVSYGIAVSRNDVQRIWPFISDTGAHPPESCIFGQLLNMSAALMMVSLYLRHRHIMAFFRAKEERKQIILTSRIFLGIGIFAAFGMMLVANFQENTVSQVHFLGAIIAFFLGLVYGWFQTTISFLSPRKLTPRWIAAMRLTICFLGTIFFIGVFARNMAGQAGPLPPDYNSTTHDHSSTPTTFYRDPDDPGYIPFLITTISEWCLGICLALFFLSLAFDLREVQLHPIKLQLRYCDQSSHSVNIVETEFQAQFPPPTDPKMATENAITKIEDILVLAEPEADYPIMARDPANIGIPLPGIAGVKLKTHDDFDDDHHENGRVNYRNGSTQGHGVF